MDDSTLTLPYITSLGFPNDSEILICLSNNRVVTIQVADFPEIKMIPHSERSNFTITDGYYVDFESIKPRNLFSLAELIGFKLRPVYPVMDLGRRNRMKAEPDTWFSSDNPFPCDTQPSLNKAWEHGYTCGTLFKPGKDSENWHSEYLKMHWKYQEIREEIVKVFTTLSENLPLMRLTEEDEAIKATVDAILKKYEWSNEV